MTANYCRVFSYDYQSPPANPHPILKGKAIECNYFILLIYFKHYLNHFNLSSAESSPVLGFPGPTCAAMFMINLCYAPLPLTIIVPGIRFVPVE